MARSPNRAGHGRPGTACRPLATSGAAICHMSAVRGRTESDPASSSCEATSENSGPPNMESAVRTGEPVAW